MQLFLVYLLFSTTVVFAQHFDGIVLDKKTKQPIQAMICDQAHCIQTEKNGSFLFDSNQTIHIKARGYRPFHTKKIQEYYLLDPIKIKALYLTFWGASPSSKTFKKALHIIQTTHLNSIVVDIKNEFGYTSYKTDLPYNIWHRRTIKNIQKFIKIMKKKHIYLIGRIAVFKDHLQAISNPEYAIYKGNKIWTNHDKMAWVDPFDKRSWKYVIDIAEDAAKKGFDEINFDYIRFPARDINIESKINSAIKNKSN